jgi:DNA-binding Lrp family transcriptional regulator
VLQPASSAPVAKRLDEIDLRILAELQRDGRITFQRLSELVGLSPRPCLERVRRLERAHIVLGYTTRVDLRRLVSVVAVVAQVAIKQGRGIRARFEQRIRSCPEVVECFEVSGVFDYIIKVVCPDLESYKRLIESWINDPSLPVERIESNIVLRAAKDGGVYPVSIAAARGS